MTASRRLLFVVNDAAFFLSHRLVLAHAARADGYEVHVVTPPDTGEAGIRAAGFDFHPVALDRGGMNPWRDTLTFWTLYRLMRRLRPQIVHTVTIKPVIYGGIAARLAGVPALVSAISGLGYVFLARGVRARAMRALVLSLYRLALRHPSGVTIAQNPDDRALLLMHRLTRPERIALIRGSGVDLARFSPQPEPAAIPQVLLVARMLWDKGVGEFVEAARQLRAQALAARFVLVGASDRANPSAIPESQLRGWHEEGVIEWLGQRDDVPQLLAASHLICLPSYREGLSKVLTEAAAAGRAIVTTDTPGCRDVVRDGVNGVLVPVRDATALAQAIRRLLQDPRERERMGQRGREIAQNDFAVQHVVAQTLALYRQCETIMSENRSC